MVKRPARDVDSASVTRRLDALLELTKVSRERPIDEVLEAVVGVVERVVGFTTVVVNLYRPAWDDYQVVLVHGTDAAREALLHTVNPRVLWEEAVLNPAYEKVPGAFFLDADDPGAWAGIESYVDPDMEPASSGPDRWRAEDGLFVALRASDGSVLGILSLDNPCSGQRPNDEDLEMLVALTHHASAALESARYAAEAERHRQTLADLLRVSSRLASHTTIEGVLDEVCTSTVPALGFETVAVYLRVGDALERRAACGPGNHDTPLDMSVALRLLGDPNEHGCLLIDRSEAGPGTVSSRQNGRGPLAWNDHRLLVPMRTGRGELTGLVVVDDPIDRLLPDPARCQALRLLADNAAAIVASITRQSHVEYLASHDPLTGVRNRRDLHRVIDAHAAGPDGVSVLMCDLDNFKAVNDQLGHDAGDRVLERFGTVLREQARADDIPVRTGGEEFCLVLPRVDAHGAMVAAERLRQATVDAMADIVPGLTVSIGAATSGPRAADAARLLAAADLALYAAKAGGRNQASSAGVAPVESSLGATTT